MISIVPLRKIPLEQYENLRENFKNLEKALEKGAPFEKAVICMLASWTEDDSGDASEGTEKIVHDGIIIVSFNVK